MPFNLLRFKSCDMLMPMNLYTPTKYLTILFILFFSTVYNVYSLSPKSNLIDKLKHSQFNAESEFENFLIDKISLLKNSGYSVIEQESSTSTGTTVHWDIFFKSQTIGHLRISTSGRTLIINEIYPHVPSKNEFGRALLTLLMLYDNRFVDYEFNCETASPSAHKMFTKMKPMLVNKIITSWANHWIIYGKIIKVNDAFMEKIKSFNLIQQKEKIEISLTRRKAIDLSA